MANTQLAPDILGNEIFRLVMHGIRGIRRGETVHQDVELKLGDSCRLVNWPKNPLTSDPLASAFSFVNLDCQAKATVTFEDSDLTHSIDRVAASFLQPLATLLVDEIGATWPPGERLVVANLPLPSAVDFAKRIALPGVMSIRVVMARDVTNWSYVMRADCLCGVTGGWSYAGNPNDLLTPEAPTPIRSPNADALLAQRADALLAQRAALQAQLDRLKAA